MKIADMKVTELINEVGAGTPAPGGGAVAGLAGGVGVALTMMVNGLTLDKKGFENDRERLLDAIAKGNELKERFIDVMNRDSEVFEALRDRVATADPKPVVFMACLGARRDFGPREQFTSNVLLVAGIDHPQSEGGTADEIVQQVQAAGARAGGEDDVLGGEARDVLAVLGHLEADVDGGI